MRFSAIPIRNLTTIDLELLVDPAVLAARVLPMWEISLMPLVISLAIFLELVQVIGGEEVDEVPDLEMIFDTI